MDSEFANLVNNSRNSWASPAVSGLHTSTDANLLNVTVTSVTTQEEFKWNFVFSVSLAVILSISAFLAVVGNSMVLTVVIRHRGMRTRTNLFLVNLAVADLLVGAAVVPFAITTLIEGKWIFGPETGTFCTINGWLNCFCLVASIHTLMYISIHKHYSITQPLASHFKLRQILGMMAAAWIWAAVSSTITVTGLSSVRYKLGTSQCGPEYPDGLKSYLFHGIIQVTNIATPAIILAYCYTRMFRAIRAHSRRLQQNSTLEQDVILAQQKKVTITLFIVLAAFVICALPFHLYASYTTISKDKKHFSPYLNPLAYCSLYLNSALNPIIYAFRSPSFREGYKEILCQTPTYIISDDLATSSTNPNIPFRRRFSSLFDSFRISGSMSPFLNDHNRSSFSSLASQPGSLASNSPGQRPPQTKRQRSWETSGGSLAGLIRSSRRSTKRSSVIRQNGNIIIVKNGKIVSVRRQSETHQTASGLGSLESGLLRSQMAPSPLVTRGDEYGMESTTDNHKTSRLMGHCVKEAAELYGRNSGSSVGSDSVFDDEAGGASQMGGSPLEKISEEKRLLAQGSADFNKACAAESRGDSVLNEENKFFLQEHENNITDEWQASTHMKEDQKHKAKDKVISGKNKELLPSELCKQTEQKKTLTERNFCKTQSVNSIEMSSERKPLPASAVLDCPSERTERDAAENVNSKRIKLKTDVGIIISIDDDNSILDVMPLTPATRDRITRSDWFLNQELSENQNVSGLVPLKAAHSTQGLCKRSLHRLPSVEYLDPPVRLRPTSSDYSVSKIQRSGGTKVKLLKPPPAPKTDRRWSLGKMLENFTHV